MIQDQLAARARRSASLLPDVEPAAVTVGGHQAWTHAFEACCPAGRRIEVIRASAVSITAGAPYPPGFVHRLTRSFGYPAWLSDVERSTFARHRPDPRD